MELIDACLSDWKSCEGLRLVVYDDATGQPITKGSFVHGNPTIGYGRALNTTGIVAQEAELLAENTVARCIAQANTLNWFTTLDLPRQRVVINMIGNLGLAGFLTFKNFITALQSGDYKTASLELLNSKACAEDQARYNWLSDLVLSS